jgi:N-hydroxyarylamine O-acetyltransferase
VAVLNTAAYLDRIAYSGSTEPSAETLRALHRAHMLTVPFENLDIHLGCPIVCEEERFLKKIIQERRGGFCYELNGAFAALLCAFGFRVTLLSARVAGADGRYGLEFDHLTLLVDILRDGPRADAHSTWLADVGFGDSFVEPLLFQPNLEQSQIGRVYRLVEGKRQSESEIASIFYLEVKPGEVKAEDKRLQKLLEKKKPNDEHWKRKYSFTRQPRRLAEFAGMCAYQQTSPESHFTRQRVCSRATHEGRITLSDWRLIETRSAGRTERELAGDDEWRAVLRESFNINLPG